MFIGQSRSGFTECLIFATLGGKMGAMPAGWRGSHSAVGISPPMMVGVLAAFGKRAGGGVG
jgi:hypothetical protein